jgi:hypothetical protein
VKRPGLGDSQHTRGSKSVIIGRTAGKGRREALIYINNIQLMSRDHGTVRNGDKELCKLMKASLVGPEPCSLEGMPKCGVRVGEVKFQFLGPNI